MALHTLKIVVVDGGRAGGYATSGGSIGSASVGKQKVDKDSPLYKLIHLKERIKEKVEANLTPASVYGMIQVGHLATQTVKSVASYYISDIGRSRGDSNYQARVNSAFALGGQVLHLIGGAISGGTAGAMFGGVGAVVGAVAGLASSAISLGFQTTERIRAYNHTMAEEKVGRDYQIGRMTGGTGIRLR